MNENPLYQIDVNQQNQAGKNENTVKVYPILGKSIPRILTIPPFLPTNFKKRKGDLEKVHDMLFSGENVLLLVNGDGGIGKTSFAGKYWHEYESDYQHLGFVYVGDDILNALLNLSTALQIEYPQQMLQPERIQQLFVTLANLEKPCLLVLDNANDASELNKCMTALMACKNLHVLLTSRLDNYQKAPKHKILPLDKASALELFQDYYTNFHESEKEAFNQVYDSVAGNTLILELLAKNLNHFNSKLKKHYTLNQLLADLQKSLLNLSYSKEVETAYQAKGTGLRNEKPEVIILAMYDLCKLTEEEIRVLNNLSVLPPQNINYATLEKLLDSEENKLLHSLYKNDPQNFKNILKSIDANITDEFLDSFIESLQNAQALDTTLLSLAEKGWIDFNEEESSFKVSPVVQEICRYNNHHRLESDCKTLINKLNKLFEADDFNAALPFLEITDFVLNNLSSFTVLIFKLTLNLSQKERSIGNLQKAEKILTDLTDILKNNQSLQLKLDSEYGGIPILNACLAMLGEISIELGNLTKALESFNNLAESTSTLLEKDPTNSNLKNGLAISYSKLGETHQSLGNLDKALQFFELRSQLGQELFQSFPNDVSFKNGLAISYSKLGDTYKNLGNLDKALQFFESETELFQELFQSFPNNVSFKNGLAISYSKLGDTHTSLGNLDKALQFFELRSQLGKELFQSFPNDVSFKNGLAISYEKLGETHQSLGNLDKALQFFELRSQLGKELFQSFPNNVSFKNGLAISYEKLGDTHTSLGNLDKALQFFESETELFQELFQSVPNNVSFKNGLAISYEKLGDTHKSLGNLDKALQFFELRSQFGQELFQSFPNDVSFKNGLAVSYYKLGGIYKVLKMDDDSKNNYTQAQKLWQELSVQAPNYVEFSRNLKFINKVLQEL